MPFRPVDLHVAYGKPEVLVEAAAGDTWIQVSCTTFGASGVAGGPNYIVGILDEDTGEVHGIYVTANEWESSLEPGDKLWVSAAEELTFTSEIQITGLIRSSSAAEGEPGAERDH